MSSSRPRPDVVALLRACKELPDEDVHRLVLADWLEENATREAETALRDLIRLQVEFDRLEKTDPKRPLLAAQASALLRRHESDWLGSLNTDRVNWGLVHGLFVMTAHEEDLSHGRLGTPGFPERWGWVERLTVLGNTTSDYAAMVRAAPLGQIGTLDLRRNGLRTAGARALAGSPLLTNLCGLILSRNDLGRAGLRAITASPNLDGLVRLELDDNRLDAGDMTSLGEWADDHDLYRLSLSDNPIGGGVPLLGLDSLERLRELYLSNCGLTAADVNALGAAGVRLRELDLSRNRGIDSSGIYGLLSAGWLGSLERLDLSQTSVWAGGLRSIADCERLTALRHLGWTDVGPLDPASARAIVESPHLKNLTCLDARGGGSRISRENLMLAEKRGLSILY